MNNLSLLLSPKFLTIYNIFSVSNPFAGPTLSGGTILLLARIHGWIYPVIQNPTTENIGGGSKQKQYGAIFSKSLHLATIQIISTTFRFFDYWEGQEVCIKGIELPLDQPKSDDIPRDNGEKTVIQSPSTKIIHVAVKDE